MQELIPTTDAQALAQREGLSVHQQLRRWPARSAAAGAALLVQVALFVVAMRAGSPGVAALALALAGTALAVLLSACWVAALGQGLLHGRGTYRRAAARVLINAARTAALSAQRAAALIFIAAAPAARQRASAVRAAVIVRIGLIAATLSARLSPTPRFAPGSLARA